MEDHKTLAVYTPPTASIEPRHKGGISPWTSTEAEAAADLRAYWRVIRKRRWTILSIAAVVFTVTVIATLREKPKYQAVAMLEIEKENPNILTVQDLFQLDNVSDTYLETQYKVLESGTLARRVISELGLEKLDEFNPPTPWWTGERASVGKTQTFGSIDDSAEDNSDAMHNALKRFIEDLDVEPIKRSRLVQVSFESQDPVLAAEIVNALASNYTDENLEQRWNATQKASEWLAQQLDGLKAKLEKSEDELQQYAQQNGLLFLENQTGQQENIVDERLRELQDELTKAQADLYEKEALYRQVQAGELDSLPGIVDNKLIQDLTLQLSQLESQYAQLATTFDPAYPKVKQVQGQIDAVQKILNQERARAVNRIVDDYQAAARREALVRQAFIAQQAQANQVAEKSVQYNILKREVDTNKQLYEGLLQRLKEAGVSAGLKASNIRVVDSAMPPKKPSKPRIPLDLALGLFAGLGLGIGAAFVQEHLDNTLKNTEDVQRFLQLPALAMIPAVESLNGHSTVYGLHNGKNGATNGNGNAKRNGKLSLGQWYRIDSDAAKQSALAEAFRGLRTSVLLSAADRPPRSLLITSAQPSEGKTTISTNLAISMAQLGQRVLLIDADLRRPSLHRILHLDNARGIVSYLAGQETWNKVIQPSGVGNLDALVCGPIPPNPAELLSSERMMVLLREASQEYSLVILDSPPLLNVADSRVLATRAEGVVLVVKGGVTPRELAQRAEAYVTNVGANIIGVVLNDIDVRRDEYSYYSYHYDGYGMEANEES
jgi:polysaccharide biosynthesis transport protein